MICVATPGTPTTKCRGTFRRWIKSREKPLYGSGLNGRKTTKTTEVSLFRYWGV
jgi:hypothetical protein